MIVSVPGMNALDMNAAEDAIERLPRELVPIKVKDGLRYVKSWIYEEKVEVAKKNKNGMIAGEGPEKQQALALIARKPAANRKNMVTAQGRIDPNQNTGISIQNCIIIPNPDL
ncbi:hypothetical protein D5086_003626 [Populus alba]|uniref:Uncharacterized protein n=1 Tax=Populus alba TaxID=43335 RepID=A0ACC4D7A3_POPAL